MTNQVQAPGLDDAARSLMKERIQERLQALGMTQFRAAEMAGKHSHFIYDFLIDRKRTIKGDGLVRVAIVLRCSVDYLTGRSDEIGEPPSPLMSFGPIIQEVSNGSEG